jgi:hypothetical protein
LNNAEIAAIKRSRPVSKAMPSPFSQGCAASLPITLPTRDLYVTRYPFLILAVFRLSEDWLVPVVVLENTYFNGDSELLTV